MVSHRCVDSRRCEDRICDRGRVWSVRMSATMAERRSTTIMEVYENRVILEGEGIPSTEMGDLEAISSGHRLC